MHTGFRQKITVLAALVVLAAPACSPAIQSAAGTLIAPIAATWESNALTRVSSGMQTSAVEFPTRVIQAGQTGVAAAYTQAPALLTPAIPATGYQIHAEDIILYQVNESIRVREAAYRFSTRADYLIMWNKDRYPSITNQESKLSPGWTIIIFFGTSGRWDLVPSSEDAWKDIPGCPGTQNTGTSEITCGEVTLDLVSQKGLMKPECLPKTMVGEYKVQSRYQGAVLYRSGVPFVYGVYFDAAANRVVMGPAIIRNRSDVTICGR